MHPMYVVTAATKLDTANLCAALSSSRREEAARPKSRDAIPIHHLLNAPDGDDLAPRFPIRDTPPGGEGDEDDVTVNDAEDSSEASHWSEDYESHDVFAGASLADLDGVNFDSFFGGFESLTFGSYPLNADIQHITSGSGIVSAAALTLEPRAYEIRQLLMSAATKFAIEYPDSPQLAHLETNIGLLTHVEIDHCLNLFFNNYYRHCPIIHRPSFQPTIAPIPLVLGCVALGAMYSDPTKVAWMKGLLDLIESYIFSLPEVRDEFFGTLGVLEAPDEDAVEYHFQLFQGAYLVVIVQYFSGNLAGRRRARRQRFPSMLSLARYFGLPSAQHSNVVAIPDDIAFQRWVRIEARIRTMNVILALDSAMGIFNNVPPRINYCEVDLQLPCHPEYFELSGYAEMLQQGSFPRPRMKLIEAFQKLFVHPSELKAAYQNENLCCWDMLYLTHVLYTHCWQHLFGNPLNRISATSLAAEPHVVYEPMKIALANWKTLWDDVRAKLTRANVSEMGFETSADSYWTLVKMIVLRFEHKKSASSTSSSINGAPTNSSGGFAHREGGASDDGMSESSMNGRAARGVSPPLDFMPLEADCDSQGAHLRKILQSTTVYYELDAPARRGNASENIGMVFTVSVGECLGLGDILETTSQPQSRRTSVIDAVPRSPVEGVVRNVRNVATSAVNDLEGDQRPTQELGSVDLGAVTVFLYPVPCAPPKRQNTTSRMLREPRGLPYGQCLGTGLGRVYCAANVPLHVTLGGSTSGRVDVGIRPLEQRKISTVRKASLKRRIGFRHEAGYDTTAVRIRAITLGILARPRSARQPASALFCVGEFSEDRPAHGENTHPSFYPHPRIGTTTTGDHQHPPTRLGK
ncbi:hypothetical protein AYO20_09654 [Fonsecaea nubica]|uniref:Xylanolytic transcriptional activator regulatory domain-containing protein n=1 Tax=Fonsecaea nubica TaxID=856822 RepID=A0A178CGF7_9EURO|nr:hypothetical protein AYO20_09654 [Fonsecaea nubica]OAL27801.1 hypothetical protein AYO20_09654 [Fonsecaea nubica]